MARSETPKEREERIKKRDKILRDYERRQEEEFRSPEMVARRKWLKEICDNDIDKLAHFASAMMKNESALHKENEELVGKLNHIYSMGFGLSKDSKALPHQKYNIARITLEHDPEDPVARAFLDAFKTSRTLTASANARKAHAPTNKAKAFVRQEWKTHCVAYEGNKSAFTRDYVKRVFNEFNVTVTEKQMREVWLRDTPPASKPDGMPAGGE